MGDADENGRSAWAAAVFPRFLPSRIHGDDNLQFRCARLTRDVTATREGKYNERKRRVNQTYRGRDLMFMRRDVYGPFNGLNRDKIESLENLWARFLAVPTRVRGGSFRR